MDHPSSVVPATRVPTVAGATRTLQPAVLGATRLPQTGLLWWPVPVLGALGILLLILGIVNRKKYNNG